MSIFEGHDSFTHTWEIPAEKDGEQHSQLSAQVEHTTAEDGSYELYRFRDSTDSPGLELSVEGSPGSYRLKIQNGSAELGRATFELELTGVKGLAPSVRPIPAGTYQNRVTRAQLERLVLQAPGFYSVPDVCGTAGPRTVSIFKYYDENKKLELLSIDCDAWGSYLLEDDRLIGDLRGNLAEPQACVQVNPQLWEQADFSSGAPLTTLKETRVEQLRSLFFGGGFSLRSPVEILGPGWDSQAQAGVLTVAWYLASEARSSQRLLFHLNDQSVELETRGEDPSTDERLTLFRNGEVRRD